MNEHVGSAARSVPIALTRRPFASDVSRPTMKLAVNAAVRDVPRAKGAWCHARVGVTLFFWGGRRVVGRLVSTKTGVSAWLRSRKISLKAS